jgi:hypothetical protein
VREGKNERERKEQGKEKVNEEKKKKKELKKTEVEKKQRQTKELVAPSRRSGLYPIESGFISLTTNIFLFFTNKY